MSITLRPGQPDDAAPCAAICYTAFATISGQHNFPPDFPDVEAAHGLMSMMLAHPAVYSVIAEVDGRIAGSNFLWETSSIAGVGPITVDPAVQNGSVGRELMEEVLRRGRERKFDGVRLVQAAFHNRSLSLYSKLGFDVQEPLSCMQGSPLNVKVPGCRVRPAKQSDLEACHQLCRDVHGHDRAGETAAAIERGEANVVERDGKITGYSTQIGFFGHAVGRTNADVEVLIGAAREISGPGFLLPSRNAELFRWCLRHGLRVVQPMTLMSVGKYQQPRGAFLPSILF